MTNILIVMVILQGEPVHYTHVFNKGAYSKIYCLDRAGRLIKRMSKRDDVEIVYIGCKLSGDPV